METDLTAEEMESELRDILNNRMKVVEPGKNKEIDNPNYSHAIMFVFDWSQVESFQIVWDYIEAFKKVNVGNG